MRRRLLMSAVRVLGILVIGLLWTLGCEDQPDMGNIDQHFKDNPYGSNSREDYETSALYIEPGAASISRANQSVSFTARGGVPPFYWAVANTGFGRIRVPAEDRYATYTSITTNQNQVIVSDRHGRTAIAAIN